MPDTPLVELLAQVRKDVSALLEDRLRKLISDLTAPYEFVSRLDLKMFMTQADNNKLEVFKVALNLFNTLARQLLQVVEDTERSISC